MPREFPHWSTVYGVFRNWQLDATWKQVHDPLPEMGRKSAGKKPTPTKSNIAETLAIQIGGAGSRRGRRSRGAGRLRRGLGVPRAEGTRPHRRVARGAGGLLR